MDAILAAAQSHREILLAILAAAGAYFSWPWLQPLLAKLRGLLPSSSAASGLQPPASGLSPHAVLDASITLDAFLASHQVPRDRRQRLMQEITPHLCCAGEEPPKPEA